MVALVARRPPLGQTLRLSLVWIGIFAAAVLLSGVFFLLSERGPTQVFRSVLVYAALLAAWGLWELRPERVR